MEGITKTMEYELGFTRDRQKTGQPYKLMTATLEKAKAYRAREFATNGVPEQTA